MQRELSLDLPDQPAPAAQVVLTQAAALVGVALVLTGLYAWSAAEVWAQQANRVEVAAWSVRSLSIALIALGQVLFAWLVLPRFFPRRGRGAFEMGYALACGLLALLSLVAAAALAAAAGW